MALPAGQRRPRRQAAAGPPPVAYALMGIILVAHSFRRGAPSEAAGCRRARTRSGGLRGPVARGHWAACPSLFEHVTGRTRSSVARRSESGRPRGCLAPRGTSVRLFGGEGTHVAQLGAGAMCPHRRLGRPRQRPRRALTGRRALCQHGPGGPNHAGMPCQSTRVLAPSPPLAGRRSRRRIQSTTCCGDWKGRTTPYSSRARSTPATPGHVRGTARWRSPAPQAVRAPATRDQRDGRRRTAPDRPSVRPP